MSEFLRIPQMVDIIIPHTLSAYLIIPHSTSSNLGGAARMGTLGLEGVSGNGRRECLLANASVFGKARGGQMETQKCVRKNYRGHVFS